MNGAGRASIAFYVFDTAELYEGASSSQRRRCCGKAAIGTMIDFRALRCSCDWHFLMSCRLHYAVTPFVFTASFALPDLNEKSDGRCSLIFSF